MASQKLVIFVILAYHIPFLYTDLNHIDHSLYHLWLDWWSVMLQMQIMPSYGSWPQAFRLMQDACRMRTICSLALTTGCKHIHCQAHYTLIWTLSIPSLSRWGTKLATAQGLKVALPPEDCSCLHCLVIRIYHKPEWKSEFSSSFLFSSFGSAKILRPAFCDEVGLALKQEPSKFLCGMWRFLTSHRQNAFHLRQCDQTFAPAKRLCRSAFKIWCCQAKWTGV